MYKIYKYGKNLKKGLKIWVVYLNATAVANIQPPKRPDTFPHPLEYLESIIDYRRTKKRAFTGGMQIILRMMPYNLVIHLKLKVINHCILIQ